VLESCVLWIEPSTDLGAGRDVLMNLQSYHARLGVLPVASLLLMVGLVVGMRPTRPARVPKHPGLSSWLMVVIAVLGGLAIVACQMIIPYLVLIAIEAVVNARMRPAEAASKFLSNPIGPVMPRSLAGRLAESIPAVGLAVLVCLVAAGWLSSSLRRLAAKGIGSPTDRHSVNVLVAGLGVAALLFGSAGWLVFHTLPMVQPLLMEGLELTVGLWEIGIVMLGFLVFAAGLVARALAPGQELPTDGGGDPSRTVSRFAAGLAKAVVVLVLGVVILTCLSWIVERFPSIARWFPSGLVGGVVAPIRGLSEPFWSWAKGEPSLSVLSYQPALCLLALVVPWLGWRTVGLLFSVRGSAEAPLDRVVDDPARACSFVGYWAALWALLVAALPTLALAGLMLLHQAIGASGR